MDAFNEVKAVGSANSAVRTPDQTAVAKFWSANVVRQYNAVAREIVDAIFNAADEFAAGAEVFDDQTVVVLKVK